MQKITLYAVLILTGLTICITAPAQVKSADLTYRYSSGKPVIYVNQTKMHEVMDVNGQPMDVNVSGILGCTVKSSSTASGGLNLEIEVDTIAEIVDSPQGMMGGTVGDIKGKSFSITLKPTGEVVDISGAKNTVYTVPGQGPNNMASAFADFFPVLPGRKVEAGFSWNSLDTVNSEAGVNTQVTVITSQNKFEGFEEMLGINCAKITSATEGTSVMINEVQGMKMTTNGTFTGTIITWFDPASGVLVKTEGNTKMTGQLDMPNEGYSFPVVIDITETNEIKK